MKSISLLVLCGLSVAFGANPYLKEKPDWVKTCYLYSDPEFYKCSTEAIAVVFKKLSSGMPEIHILPLDPLTIPEIYISEGGSGPVSLNASFKDAVVTGLSDIKVIKNDVSPKNLQWDTHIYIPKMRIEGQYTARGQILIVPIKGSGPSWFEVGKLDGFSVCKVSLKRKKDHSFYDVHKCEITFKIGELKFNLGNLFDGQKELEVQTNRYLNENWREVEVIIEPLIKQTIEAVVLNYLKQFFDNVPAEYFVADLKDPSEYE